MSQGRGIALDYGSSLDRGSPRYPPLSVALPPRITLDRSIAQPLRKQVPFNFKREEI